jgi:hypothetical protein
MPRKADKYPAALASPLDQLGFLKYADMTRDARLALVEQLGNLAHSQFEMAQQSDDSKP